MKFLFAFFLSIVAGSFFALNFSLGVFGDLLSQGKEQEVQEEILKKQAGVDLSLQEPEKEISSPTPLKIFQRGQLSSLSSEGVFQWTNTHREEAGLNLLTRNLLLDEVAKRKVQDMFAREYFEHVSPQGVGVGDLAEEKGYEFIAIGENLALGNYASDEALVQAWMDSPGHRENILGARYQEIGIALKQGLFEGESTWLGVQVFGLPLSACDFPDGGLKGTIELGKIQIGELGAILEQMRADLEAHRPKFDPSYNRKVAEYNALVDQYNTLIGEVQTNIAQYNIQVQAFNNCARQ